MQTVTPCSLHKIYRRFGRSTYYAVLQTTVHRTPEDTAVSLFTYLFMYGLFNDAVSSLDYTEWNGWMISE
jgi:hypothetical protein